MNDRLRLVRWISLLLASLLFFPALPAWAALQDGDIPPALAPWRGWVLYDREDALCPPQFNDGALTRCQWPARLQLELTSEGGQFEQRWVVTSRGWADLPGRRETWPVSVTVDGQPVAVIERDEKPMVELQPGDHRISGRFFWRQLPETLDVPPALGLLSLTLEGLAVSDPVLDEQGRLWLQKSAGAGDARQQLTVKLFRRLRDTIPMQVQTLVRLEVSGKGREVSLEGIGLPTAVPMDLSSRLPARIDAEGRLLVQARPGRWEILLTSRIPGPVQRLAPNPSPYGAEEVWSFEPHHELRMVEIEGVPPVEPGQTEMPARWRHLPAYLVKPLSPMIFKETRRGDAQPAPDRLNLKRTWWLDFDGRGFSVHDEISGTLSRQWSLAMSPPLVLGRVAVDGEDRVITGQGDGNLAGVELRRGRLNLQADARMPRGPGRIPALGWAHDFQQVSGLLHLPPGWKLLAAFGVDEVSDTWLQRWSLLDFFIVLIISLAVLKLRSWPWALAALAALVLIYHEPGAPRLVWLHILAVLAVTPLLPAGWFKRLLILWGIGAVVVLVVTAVPFMVQQVRWGMYPQLSPSDLGYLPPSYDLQPEELERGMQEAMPLEAPQPPEPQADVKPKVSSLAKKEQAPVVWKHDPDAVIPTGPGLPDWQWRAIRLNWNGPVAADQGLRLVLLSPLVNLALALFRVGFLAALIWGLLGRGPWRERMRRQLQPAAALLGLVVVSGILPGHLRADEGAAFPPPALLDTLRERLLEKPDCLPRCADISRMEVTAGEDELQIILKVHAALKVAVPLPVNRKSWQPQQVLLDNAPISGLARDDNGQLWALVPEGAHTLVLLGRTGQEGIVQLPLPLRPHAVAVAAEGWTVKGIQPDGTAGSSLVLTRLQGDEGRSATVQGGTTLPPFLQVERVLHLGLTWQVTTTVTRLTPPGAPVVVSLPLLDGEAVTTAGFQVDHQEVLINLSAEQNRTTFESNLAVAQQIRLKAPRTVPWTETWILDAGPMWHCDLAGIPVIHQEDQAGQWRPQWRPWPGEQVSITVQRPKAVAGQWLTVDRADLVLTPGRRFGEGQLLVRIRTSRGGQHTLELPPKANLQQVTVNGRSLPIRQDGAYVTVPLQPGVQTVDLKWQQLAPFSAWYRTPKVALGQQAVNARVSINMPAGRWILMAGGPRWGPAILFWSYLTIIVLAALGLGRVPLTPLKTWQWLLLGLGLTQIPAATALIIVGWLLALGLRERRSMPGHWLGYDTIQVGLVVWTVAALVCMFLAVEAGLLGQPEMQIAGNGSHARLLNWTQDMVGGAMPRAWVFSLPVWVFSVFMLAWSLWLAFSLLGWLKWGWRCFSREGLWRKVVLRKKKTVAPEGPENSEPERT